MLQYCACTMSTCPCLPTPAGLRVRHITWALAVKGLPSLAGWRCDEQPYRTSHVHLAHFAQTTTSPSCGPVQCLLPTCAHVFKSCYLLGNACTLTAGDSLNDLWSVAVQGCVLLLSCHVSSGDILAAKYLRHSSQGWSTSQTLLAKFAAGAA